MSKPLRKKTYRTAGEQHAAVKLDTESVADMDIVVDMREVMVRTGNDMGTLVIDMTITVWWLIVGHRYPYLAGNFMIV